MSDQIRDLTAEVRFSNGYRLSVGPSGDDGRREVRVYDAVGRASGHTAVDSIAELRALAARVRSRAPVAGRRDADGQAPGPPGPPGPATRR